MSDVIGLLKKCIKKEIHLGRTDRKWQLSENGITIEFEVPDSNSLGFSLDQNNVKDVFSFFAGSPPKGITKMCDGIIAFNYEKQTYIFLLEQKTNNLNNYKKQLINGWHFCQWLFALLKEHNHYAGSVKYIGLVYSSRQRAYKETSTHPKPELKSGKHGINFSKTDKKLTYLKSYI